MGGYPLLGAARHHRPTQGAAPKGAALLLAALFTRKQPPPGGESHQLRNRGLPPNARPLLDLPQVVEILGHERGQHHGLDGVQAVLRLVEHERALALEAT